MQHAQVNQILDKIHKNKFFNPTEEERVFLDDLSFYATIGNIKISEKQGKQLNKIYRKAQECL